MDKPQIIGHIQKSLNYTVYDCKWIPSSSKFVAMGAHARGTGALQVYDIGKTDVKLIQEWEKPKSIRCGTFAGSDSSGRCLAAGDMDGVLSLWNIEKTDSPMYRVKAHEGVVNAIDGVGGAGVGEGAAEIVTGGRDGRVRVWDRRQEGEPVASMDPAPGETARDCWTVAFGHAYNAHDRCVAAGYDNGDLKLFDLRTMSVRWETSLRNGVCSLQFDRRDIAMNKLVATTLEGGLHVFDMRTHHPREGFASVSEKAHSSTVWAARHLPSNRDVFMTTGGAGSLNLWKYHYPSSRTALDTDHVPRGVPGSLELLQNITMSSQPISSFDWSRDKAGLAVCSSFDQTVRVLIVTRLATL